MYFYNNKYLRDRRKELRNNSTPQEAILWNYLKSSKLGVKFRRQYGIGPYIVDFCSRSKRIVVELDGSQHIENKKYDLERTEYLETDGFKVLRFWNYEVDKNIDAVLMRISEELK